MYLTEGNPRASCLDEKEKKTWEWVYRSAFNGSRRGPYIIFMRAREEGITINLTLLEWARAPFRDEC